MVVGKQHESTRKSNTKGVIREGEIYISMYIVIVRGMG